MHPLWNLLPAAFCAAVFAFAILCTFEETRDGLPKRTAWLLPAIAATGISSAIATAISAAPLIAWTIGALP